MAAFKSIVVPTDFSHCAERAVELGVRLARENDATLTLVHTWEVPVYAYSAMPLPPLDMWTPIESAARAQLDTVTAEVKKQIPAVRSILRRGFAPEQILEAAAEAKADLIVMGTHGRHGLPRVLLGSVAERVVRTAPIPVLTVHTPPAEKK